MTDGQASTLRVKLNGIGHVLLGVTLVMMGQASTQGVTLIVTDIFFKLGVMLPQ